MNTYGKLISGTIRYAPSTVRDKNGKTVFNPGPETLLSLGYKPVRVEEQPEVQDGFWIRPVYTETDSEIVQVWKEEKIPEQPVDATARLDEIFRILSGAE